MLNALMDWIKSSADFLTHILLLIIVSFAVGLFYSAIEKPAEREISDAVKLLLPMEGPPKCDKKFEANPLQGNRVREQYKTITDRMAHHMTVMMLFYRRYYTAIEMASFAGVTAAILLLVISKAGWSATSEFLIALFLYMSATSIVFVGEPLILKEPENIAANKSLFLSYSNLAEQLRSYCATGLPAKMGDTKSEQFIRSVDQQVAKIQDISVAFDSTKIPTIADFTAQLEKGNKGN